MASLVHNKLRYQDVQLMQRKNDPYEEVFSFSGDGVFISGGDRVLISGGYGVIIDGSDRVFIGSDCG